MFEQHLAQGDWYPRWFAEHYGSYGYPYLNFYAPAIYYLTVLLAWLLPGEGVYGGMQLVGVIGALGMISGVYALGWKLWRHGPAAFFAAAIVAYAPYPIAINFFVRGAIPETVAAGSIVWLLVAGTGLWFAAAEDRRVTPWVLLTGAIAVVLLLTHNLSALLGAFITPAWLGCLWLWRPNRRALLLLVGAAVGAAVLTAFFWLPALLEVALVQFDQIHSGGVNFRNWFLTWPGYHSPFWGLQERALWTRGFPIDLHLVYPHWLHGPPPLSLWQGVLLLGALFALALTATPLGRRRAAMLRRPSTVPEHCD